MLIGAQSVIEAFDEGRTWASWLSKTGVGNMHPGNAGGLDTFNDVSLATGIPALDPRIGAEPLKFFPCDSRVKDGKQLDLGPSLPGCKRYLHSIEGKWNGTVANGTYILYDLLGYYPMIDCSDRDTYTFDNTLSLPRCADGAGVQMFLFRHVAPPSGGDSDVSISFVGSDGVDRSTPLFATGTNGDGNVACMQLINSGGFNGGRAPWAPLPSGVRGIRRATSITIGGNGGYVYLALVKPLYVFGPCTANYIMFSRDLGAQNGFRYPEIPDGACLNFYEMHKNQSAGAHILQTTCLNFFHA